MDKFTALSMPDRAIIAGGALMLIASILDWFSFEGFGSSGWGRPGSIWSVLAIVLAVGTAGLTAAMRLGNFAPPTLPQGITWGKAYGGAAAVLVVLMLLKAWRIVDFPIGGFGIGFFLALIATGAIAYGGYMLYTEEKARGG